MEIIKSRHGTETSKLNSTKEGKNSQLNLLKVSDFQFVMLKNNIKE